MITASVVNVLARIVGVCELCALYKIIPKTLYAVTCLIAPIYFAITHNGNISRTVCKSRHIFESIKILLSTVVNIKKFSSCFARLCIPQDWREHCCIIFTWFKNLKWVDTNRVHISRIQLFFCGVRLRPVYMVPDSHGHNMTFGQFAVIYSFTTFLVNSFVIIINLILS